MKAVNIKLSLAENVKTFVNIANRYPYDIDLRVGAQIAIEIPFLLLTAELAAPNLAQKIGRQIIGDPAFGLIQRLDQIGSDAGFFPQLAQRGGAGLFVVVNPALRHLPRSDLGIEALARKDQALGVDQHDTNTGTVGQFFGVCHRV